MLYDVQPSSNTLRAYLMTCQMVFRYVVNVRLMSCRSDRGPLSPLRRLVPILHLPAILMYSQYKDEVSCLITALVSLKFPPHKKERSVFLR